MTSMFSRRRPGLVLSMVLVTAGLVMGTGYGSVAYSVPPTTEPTVSFPSITLNGTEQTVVVTLPLGQVNVTAYTVNTTPGWSVSATMVATGNNPNTGCQTSPDFCNSASGANASNPDNHILATDLSVSAIACPPQSGNTNPAAVAGPGGSFGPPASPLVLCTDTNTNDSGTFDVNATFTLVIPSSTLVGTFIGTVEFVAA
jgi:hypothetical protein